MEARHNISIRAHHVSKAFHVEQGVQRASYLTLRDQLAQAFRNPFGRSSRARNEKGQPVDQVWALEDVSFEVRSGEVVGLIGPNGAGKSTLLKILTRITGPTSGSIDIYGRVGSLLEVGTGFHRELSGRDNVYLNGTILGMRKAEIDRKFDEIVAFAEVEKFIDTEVKYYSSGMAVRLAFSVAAHLEPEILLVDEVLAVGDAAFQKKSLSKMESVGRSGRTVIFVSHHMPSITRLCERAMLLQEGRLLMSGPAEQVVADYLSAHLGVTALQEWPDARKAPASEDVRLRSVRVIDWDGDTNYSFDVRKPVGIEITYDILRQTHYAIYPYFKARNEEEVGLFTSIDTDKEWRGQVRSPGRYCSVAWIPGNLLTEGVVTVGVGMRTELPQIRHFFENDAVAFQIVGSPDGDSARVDFAGKLRDAFNPYLNWSTRYEPEILLHPSSVGRK
jgi:lipopolysaccharide transport system ATP-binding protein